MGLSTVLLILAMFFLPPFLIAWDARRRGGRWIVWFLAAVAGPALAVLGSFAVVTSDPVPWIAYNLVSNPLSYLAWLVAIVYLARRPWRYPVPR